MHCSLMPLACHNDVQYQGNGCSGGIEDTSDAARKQFTARFLLAKGMLMIEVRRNRVVSLFRTCVFGTTIMAHWPCTRSRLRSVQVVDAPHPGPETPRSLNTHRYLSKHELPSTAHICHAAHWYVVELHAPKSWPVSDDNRGDPDIHPWAERPKTMVDSR